MQFEFFTMEVFEKLYVLVLLPNLPAMKNLKGANCGSLKWNVVWVNILFRVFNRIQFSRLRC